MLGLCDAWAVAFFSFDHEVLASGLHPQRSHIGHVNPSATVPLRRGKALRGDVIFDFTGSGLEIKFTNLQYFVRHDLADEGGLKFLSFQR